MSEVLFVDVDLDNLWNGDGFDEVDLCILLIADVGVECLLADNVRGVAVVW